MNRVPAFLAIDLGTLTYGKWLVSVFWKGDSHHLVWGKVRKHALAAAREDQFLNQQAAADGKADAVGALR